MKRFVDNFLKKGAFFYTRIENYFAFLSNPLKAFYIRVCLLIGIWILFFVRGVYYLDPDFGWHLRIGEIILNSGIPDKDPLSYTMPNFPFVDHEWLTNILIAFLFPQIGFWGLAAIYASLVVLIIDLLIPFRQLKIYQMPVVILASSIFFSFSGIRPQIESWLFLVLILRTVLDEALWQRWRFFIPLLSLAWVNLHGGFALGIGVLLIFITTKFITQRKILREDLSVLGLSFLMTFFNPYGARVWEEVWRQMSDPFLRASIGEWMPLFLKVSVINRISTFTFLIAATALMIIFRKKFSLLKIVLFIVFLILAISSRRHVPLFIVVSLSVVLGSLKLIYDKFEVRYKFITSILLLLVVFISSFQFKVVFKSTYNSSEDFQYPKHALEFIKKQNLEDEIFSDYGWGGYLAWKLPEKKVFIDGRMPSWRWSKSLKNESSWAFREYVEVVNKKDNFEETFNKYNIKMVLWPTNLFDSGELSEKKNVRLGGGIQSLDPFLINLEKNGWERVYLDLIAAVYVKKD